MRLLICGSRNWTDRDIILRAVKKRNPSVIIEGECQGADKLAASVAEELGIPVEKFPADWAKHGRRAGPIRNQQMLDEGKPDYVLAFPAKESRGTWDMVRRAEKAGIEIEVLE